MRNVKDGTILVINQDLKIRDEILLQVERLGYKTIWADSKSFAKTIINCFVVDKIIIEEPHHILETTDFWDDLTAMRPQPQVILVTGPHSKSISKLADKITAVVKKPLSGNKLRDIIVHCAFPTNKSGKRGQDRFNIQLQIQWALHDKNGFENGKIGNLSWQGAFIHSESELPQVGEVVNLETSFILDRPIYFQGLGIVRWTKNSPDFERGFGIEFAALNEGGHSILQTLIPTTASSETSQIL